MQFKKPNYIIFLFCLVLFAFVLSSCDDELFTTDPEKVLTFSADTLTFDTVFTTIGSTTEKILVFNPNNRALRISSIALAGGANSQFRLNVDGNINVNNEFTDIEISAKDSMYIFIEVTADVAEANPTDFL